MTSNTMQEKDWIQVEHGIKNTSESAVKCPCKKIRWKVLRLEDLVKKNKQREEPSLAWWVKFLLQLEWTILNFDANNNF